MTLAKNLTPQRRYQVKALAVGQIVKVECDHKDYGRIASRGAIVDLRGTQARLALVRLDGPIQGSSDVTLLIPKRDIHWLDLRDGDLGF